jgi:hypothetical protein
VTAIPNTRTRPFLKFGMRDRGLTRRAKPRHKAGAL